MSPRQLPLVPDTPPARVYRRIQLADVRENFVASEPDHAFTQSLQDFGLINPITVEERAGKFDIIAGRRRYLAAKALEWESIPALVLDTTGWRPNAVMSLVENEQRSRNRQAALRAANRLVEAGYAEKEIAAAIGMPLGSLRKLMKLNALIPALQEKLAGGTLAEGVAERAAALPTATQKALAKQERVTGNDVHEARTVGTQAAAQELLADVVAATPGQPYDFRADIRRELEHLGDLVTRAIAVDTDEAYDLQEVRRVIYDLLSGLGSLVGVTAVPS